MVVGLFRWAYFKLTRSPVRISSRAATCTRSAVRWFSVPSWSSGPHSPHAFPLGPSEVTGSAEKEGYDFRIMNTRIQYYDDNNDNNNNKDDDEDEDVTENVV